MISFLDALMFSLAASLTLWADLSIVELAMLLLVLVSSTLWGAE